MNKIHRGILGTFRSHKITFVVALLIVVAVLGYWFISSKTGSDNSTKVVVAGNPVKAPQTEKPSSPVEKKPVANSGANLEGGGATDTRGSAKASSSPDQWVTSASGIVTVKSPTANATLRSGDLIAGTAKVSEIHYRLKDNRVGKIADGTLSVNNGNFSGVIHFTPQGTGGQLDVFTTTSEGVELNEVQINVAF